ncbi:MOS1T transposase, partial [Pseudoatta argentina]
MPNKVYLRGILLHYFIQKKSAAEAHRILQLETLKWEVLPHPPYSPDIAPSDFHLFRSMAHGLADRRFHSYEEAQKWIDSWIASKDMSFFRRGIHVLPERWSKKSAAEAHRILVQTYGDNALSDTTCRDWFRRFKNNDFQLEDKERSGAPKKFQDKELEQLQSPYWEVLPHPPYSPDIAASDVHLFRSMAHGLADRRFHSYEEAQKWIDSWIASKDMSFFRRGIHVLPEIWEKVVSSDGQYFK